MLLTGQIIERYRVDDHIGEGGMGQVFRVYHTELQTTFALKLINRTHPEVVRRARLEAQIQSKLKHPNIVGLSDFLMLGPSPCMIMEYVDGESLHHWIARQIPGPRLEHAERIFAGVLAGMEEAHRQGLVHRDLKPGNVMLALDGTAKVADFGLVKVLGDAAVQFTTDGTVVGTPGYMAPEQAQNARDVDARTDVFALGCILYELATGDPLFRVSSLASAIAAHDQPVPLPRRDLPEHLSRVVRACTEPDRERRPNNATAVRELLGWPEGPVLGGVPVLGARPQRVSNETVGHSTHAPPAPPAPPVPPPVPDPPSQWHPSLATTITSSFLLTLAAVGVGWAVTRGSGAASPTALSPTAPTFWSPSTVPLVGYRVGGEPLIYGLDRTDLAPEADAARLRMGVATLPVSGAGLAPGVEIVGSFAVSWIESVERADVPDVLRVPPEEPKGPGVEDDRFTCGLDGLPACAVIANVERPGPAPGSGPPTTERPPAPDGSLKLGAWPYAFISVDGQNTGRKTPTTLVLPSGRHGIRLTDKDGKVREFEVTVPAGGTAHYCWSFEDDRAC